MTYAIPIVHKTKRRRIGAARRKYFDRIAERQRLKAELLDRQVTEALARAGLYTARPEEVTFQ